MFAVILVVMSLYSVLTIEVEVLSNWMGVTILVSLSSFNLHVIFGPSVPLIIQKKLSYNNSIKKLIKGNDTIMYQIKSLNVSRNDESRI